MKLRFNRKAYFPHFFIADVVIYATLIWLATRLL